MRINSKKPHGQTLFSVLLPDYYCRGNYHAEVITNVRVAEGHLYVDLLVYGEDFKLIDGVSKVYDAEGLHISTLSRK